MKVSEQRERMNVAKLYRFATKMHTLLPYYFSKSGYAFPAWHYYFEVTRTCNLRCKMCQYIQWLKETPVSVQKEGELTTEEWLAVIDQVSRFSLITFTGGEPFHRDDFMQLLERASVRCRTHFITNATLLNEELARRCVELAPKRTGGVGFNFAGVSIDGPQEVHDRIRNIRGGFERSTNGIRMLSKFRKESGKKCPMIHVTVVIQKDNLEYLSQMPQVVADVGADVLNLTLEIRTMELEGLGSKDPSDYRMSDIALPELDPERLAEALRETRIAAQKAGVELRLPDMPEAEIIQYYSGGTNLACFRCGGIWTNVIVGAKGDVYPCWLKKVGNVRDKRLKEIWNGPEMRAFRKRTRKGLYAPCAGCCFLAYPGRG